MTRASAARPWLAPLVPLYRLGLALRELRLRMGPEPVRRLRWPVISIGNLSTGGSGKTPLTIALAQALTRRGFSVDVLSRGYGRTSRAAARVEPDGTAKPGGTTESDGSAEEFGDEPLEIARAAGVPVYVAAERYQAGLLAEREAEDRRRAASPDLGAADTGAEAIDSGSRAVGPGFSPDTNRAILRRALAPAGNLSGIHLLDDGFQHRRLARDVNILMMNRQDWQDRLLPAGNLREPLRAMRRADVFVIPAEDPEFESVLKTNGWQGPIWRVHRRMEVPPADGPVVAFCGIARPEQFFHGLRRAGLTVPQCIAFPDHHRYTPSDLDRLRESARGASAAAFITTEKDRVRLGKLAAKLAESCPLRTAALRIEIEDQDAALQWIMSRLSSRVPEPPR